MEGALVPKTKPPAASRGFDDEDWQAVEKRSFFDGLCALRGCGAILDDDRPS